MLAGFSGYATGPLLGGLLVQSFGFSGLYFLLIPAAALLWFFHKARVKLALDGDDARKQERRPTQKTPAAASGPAIPFNRIFLLAVLINSGCGIMGHLI